MTGLAIERLGRVPDKLHVALLDLLGIELDGPAAARTEPADAPERAAAEPLEIRAGTEAGTLRTATQESIVFGTVRDFTILPLRPAAYVVQRGGAPKEIGVADGVAYPTGPDQLPFSRPPQTGDALYLGFEESLSRLLMQRVDRGLDGTRCRRQARRSAAALGGEPGRRHLGRGRRAGGPHRRLQLRLGDGRGAVPAGSGIEPIAGRRLHWLRCRIAETTRVTGEPAVYTQPPEIYQITAAPIGALLAAEHSAVEIAEQTVGVSDGTPGQTFATRFAPRARARARARRSRSDRATGDWEPWEEQVDSFAGSGGR